jgi:hypothetical protein
MKQAMMVREQAQGCVLMVFLVWTSERTWGRC